MNSIFGIGPLELFFIAILALVILGPERLPGVIREGAKYFRMLRNMSGELTSQFSEELKALDEINPKKIMNEMMEDLDLEEEKKALAELNPKKIQKDIKSGLNPMKAKSTKSAATEKTEKATAMAATTTATAATTETNDESVEPMSAQPLAEPKKAVADGSATDANEGDAVTEVTSESVEQAADASAKEPIDILARSQPKMTSNPFKKSSDSKKTSPQPDPTEDTVEAIEPLIENRIAPDELAANIESVEPASQPEPSSSTASTNGTHDSAHDNSQDSSTDDTGDRA